MISFEGGLGANAGVMGPGKKGHLLHYAAHDQHNLTQRRLLQRGLILQVQLHSVWGFTPNAQPGVFSCLLTNTDR